MSARRVFGEWAAPGGALDAARLAELERLLVEGCPPTPGPVVDVHAHLGRDADGHALAAADLVADMESHGVDRAVCFPANEPGDGDVAFAASNAAVADAARELPGRIVPFCRVDPSRGAAEAMERAAADGARGLKLHPVGQRFSPDSRECVACVRDATRRGWPVLFHAGYGARALAAPFAALLDAAPGCRLILAHAARGDARAVWDVARGRDDVWWDTSLAALADVVMLPPSRVVFGADRPYGEHATARQLVALAAAVAGWDDAQLAGVMGRNAQDLLGDAA